MRLVTLMKEGSHVKRRNKVYEEDAPYGEPPATPALQAADPSPAPPALAVRGGWSTGAPLTLAAQADDGAAQATAEPKPAATRHFQVWTTALDLRPNDVILNF